MMNCTCKGDERLNCENWVAYGIGDCLLDVNPTGKVDLSKVRFKLPLSEHELTMLEELLNICILYSTNPQTVEKYGRAFIDSKR